MKGKDWTRETELALVGAWNDGISASIIADRFGISRNAVLGKIHRLRSNQQLQIVARKMAETQKPRKLPKLQPAFRRPPPQRVPSAREPLLRPPPLASLPKAPAIAQPPPREPPPVEEFATDIIELDDSRCRWANDGPPWKFCGAPTEPESRYCPGHARRAYQGRDR